MDCIISPPEELTAVDLTPLIGSEIEADAEALLSGKHAGQIRQLLETRGVVVIRDIQFDDAQQKAFSKTLGVFAVQRGTEFANISLDPKVNPEASDNLLATFYWHLDGTNTPLPNFAIVVVPRKLSDVGGETEFAHTYAAWEDLPEAEKAAYEGLRVVHSLEAARMMGTPEPRLAELERWRSWGSHEQPLVWTHRSGRKSLVVGGSASHVVGKSPEDSRRILTRLREWATQPQYVYQHKWRMGDLLIWNNTGTIHRVLPYAADSGRLLRRCAVEGEEPIA